MKSHAHRNEIKVKETEYLINGLLNTNSNDIIIWNVFSRHENDNLLKIAILGIHRTTRDSIDYEVLQIEFLTNQHKHNLEYILSDPDILNKNFVDMTRGDYFVFPVISPNYHEKDKYIFALVK